jgi:lysophospholipase L1-like esterase
MRIYKRVKSSLLNILLIIISIFFALIIAELIIRCLIPECSKNFTYGKLIVRNTDGFRDRDFMIPKPPSIYRILVLGDSFVWGVGLDMKDTLPKILESMLHKEMKTPKIEVINAGEGGYNTRQELLRFRDKGLKYEPNMVILVYFLNDVLNSVLPEKKNTKSALNSITTNLVRLLRVMELRSRIVMFVSQRIRDIIRKIYLDEQNPFLLVDTMNNLYTNDYIGWVNSKKDLFEISRICKEHNAYFIGVIYPALYYLDNYRAAFAHKAISDYFHSINVPVIDLLPFFQFKGKRYRSLWINLIDGHPNAEANYIAAKALVPTMKNYIEKEAYKLWKN